MMTEILIGLGGTIVGGVVVWIIQQYYLNRREQERRQAETVISAGHSNKVITDDIFFDLAPGKTIELMKQMLGAPRAYSRLDAPVFSDDAVETHSYLYFFKNARLKITSVDNQTIDSLTIFGDNSLSVEHLFYPCDGSSKLDEARVCQELIDDSQVTAIHSMRDSSFAIQYTVAAPIYMSYMYFGETANSWEFLQSKNPNLFLHESIEGVCISHQGGHAYFICDSEIRLG